MQKIISLKQELLDIIDSITPIMFFWLNAVVWSLLLICGYLLLEIINLSLPRPFLL